MCGRFNVISDPLAEIFLQLTGEPFPGADNRNTAPTEPAWIVGQSRDNVRRRRRGSLVADAVLVEDPGYALLDVQRPL